MTTIADHIEGIKADAAKRGQDFCYGILWRWDGEKNEPAEMRVEFLEPGKYPKAFLETTEEAGMHWDKAWTIVRVVPQPTAQVISLKPGAFLATGMPDVEF
jgi:hypothetical protein